LCLAVWNGIGILLIFYNYIIINNNISKAYKSSLTLSQKHNRLKTLN